MPGTILVWQWRINSEQNRGKKKKTSALLTLLAMFISYISLRCIFYVNRDYKYFRACYFFYLTKYIKDLSVLVYLLTSELVFQTLLQKQNTHRHNENHVIFPKQRWSTSRLHALLLHPVWWACTVIRFRKPQDAEDGLLGTARGWRPDLGTRAAKAAGDLEAGL